MRNLLFIHGRWEPEFRVGQKVSIGYVDYLVEDVDRKTCSYRIRPVAPVSVTAVFLESVGKAK